MFSYTVNASAISYELMVVKYPRFCTLSAVGRYAEESTTSLLCSTPFPFFASFSSYLTLSVSRRVRAVTATKVSHSRALRCSASWHWVIDPTTEQTFTSSIDLTLLRTLCYYISFRHIVNSDGIVFTISSVFSRRFCYFREKWCF